MKQRRIRARVLVVVLVVLQSSVVTQHSKRAPARFFAMEYSRDDILVPVKLQSERGISILTTAIIDTGSVGSYVDEDYVQMFGLRPMGSTDIIGVTGDRKRAPMVVLPKLTFGPTEIEQLQVVSHDLGQLSRAHRRDIGAMLGMDALQKFVVTIDYREQRMAISDRPLKQASAKLVGEIPFEFKDGLPVATCELGGVGRLSFILDTGRRGAPLIRGKDAERITFSGPTVPLLKMDMVGSEINEEQGEVASLRCASLKWEPVLVSRVRAQGIEKTGETPGLLGSGTLDRYLVELDFPGRKARFFCSCP